MGFKPGNCANPKGRPRKEHSLTAILEQLGDEPWGESGVTRKQALAALLWQKAIDEGDMPAIKYIYDRIDGLPVAKQEISGNDGEPVSIKVIFE